MGNSSNTRGRRTVQRTKDTPVSNAMDRSDIPGKGESGEATTEVLLPHMMSRQKRVISRITARDELGRRIRDMGLVPGIPVGVQGACASQRSAFPALRCHGKCRVLQVLRELWSSVPITVEAENEMGE